jgi:hypothetical protein
VCVTNKTGFLIWWSNLLNPYPTGCNSSQITTWHTVIFFRLDTPRELFWLPTIPLYSLVHLCTLYSSNSSDCALLKFLGSDPTENIIFCCQECMFIGPLPSNGCPIAGSVTSEMCLPSRCLAADICVTLLWFMFSSKHCKGRCTRLSVHENILIRCDHQPFFLQQCIGC